MFRSSRILHTVRPDTAQALSQTISGLPPTLDAAGFHITRRGLSSDTGRFRIGYDEPVELIPEVLVDAVTRVDVDFIHGSTIAIAMLTQEYLDSLGPRRPSVTIEELVASREQ